MRGTVKQVKTKQLQNGGTLYNVNIDGNWYSTFDDNAAQIDGKQIEFEYKEVEKNGKVFKNLTEFKIAQSNNNTNGNGNQNGKTNGKSDAWINAVAIVKSGLEGGVIQDMAEAREEFLQTYCFLGHLWNGDKKKARELIRPDKTEITEDDIKEALEDG